jgi:hypothetical protein
MLEAMQGNFGAALDEVEHVDAANSTIAVTCALKQSAYKNISFSPFANGKQANVTADEGNYNAFISAARLAFGNNVVPPLVAAFENWKMFNVFTATTGMNNSTIGFDRRDFGARLNLPSALSTAASAQDVAFDPEFFNAAQGFMNLCEYLATLANTATSITTTEEQFGKLLHQMNDVLHQDVNIDFTKPILLALYKLAGAQVSNPVFSLATGPNAPVSLTFDAA